MGTQHNCCPRFAHQNNLAPADSIRLGCQESLPSRNRRRYSVSVDEVQRTDESRHPTTSSLQAATGCPNSKPRGTLPAPCMTSTSSQSTRNLRRGRSGVFRMRLLPHSRNWSRSRSSRQPRSWVSSWKPGSHNRSNLVGSVGRRRCPPRSGGIVIRAAEILDYRYHDGAVSIPKRISALTVPWQKRTRLKVIGIARTTLRRVPHFSSRAPRHCLHRAHIHVRLR